MFADEEHKALRRKIYRRMAIVLPIVLLVTINIFGLLIGSVLYNEFCVSNTRVGLERFSALQVELDKGKAAKHWQEVSIASRYGYILQGTYLPCPQTSNNTVIFVHGITASRLMGLWYANMYFDAGYNVLIYDARAHGSSGGPATSWGYFEKDDLDSWVDWVQQHHPQGIIGVHGVSMGAATALLHAQINEPTKRVRFYVADSAYADLESLLLQQVAGRISSQNPWLIRVLLDYSSAAAYLYSRFWYGDVSPIRGMPDVTTPILYLHGEEDSLVPVAMCRELYSQTKGYREIHTFPGVGHATAIFDRKAEYVRLVRQFIDKVSEPPSS